MLVFSEMEQLPCLKRFMIMCLIGVREEPMEVLVAQIDKKGVIVRSFGLSEEF
jgi:hypothetical protein